MFKCLLNLWVLVSSLSVNSIFDAIHDAFLDEVGFVYLLTDHFEDYVEIDAVDRIVQFI